MKPPHYTHWRRFEDLSPTWYRRWIGEQLLEVHLERISTTIWGDPRVTFVIYEPDPAGLTFLPDTYGNLRRSSVTHHHVRHFATMPLAKEHFNYYKELENPIPGLLLEQLL